MSLILNNISFIPVNPLGSSVAEGQHDLNMLDRYIAIIEDNKKSSRFVPNDALLALDMAGFVRDRLTGEKAAPGISAARMALALAQTCPRGPVQ